MLLTVWAIVALVATAKAHGVPEYSDDAVKALKTHGLLERPESEPIAANLINPEIEMEFLEQGNGFENLPENEVYVEAYRYLTQVSGDKQHNVCGSYLGIELPDTNEVFCNLTSFTLTQKPPIEPDGNRDLYIVLEFKMPSQPVLFLFIPIFKAPAEVVHLLESSEESDSEEQPPMSSSAKLLADFAYYLYGPAREEKEDDELTIWETNKKVGTYSLIDLTLFDLLLKGKPIFVDFGWLGELLQYGIRRMIDLPASSEGSFPIARYVCRPIVMTDPVIEKFITFAEMFNTPKGTESQEEEEEEEEEDVYDD